LTYCYIYVNIGDYMFGLVHRGELPGSTENEFEHLTTRLQHLWLVEHNEDGTHKLDEMGVALAEHTHDASDIVSGELEKARQHAETAYLDENNIWAGSNMFLGGATIPTCSTFDHGLKFGSWTTGLTVDGTVAAQIIPGITGQAFVLTYNAYWDDASGDWKAKGSGRVAALVMEGGSMWFAMGNGNPTFFGDIIHPAGTPLDIPGGINCAWKVTMKWYSHPTGNVGIGSSFNAGLNTGPIGSEPQGKLHIKEEVNTRLAVIVETINDDNAQGGEIQFRRSRGTETAPTDVQDGDSIGGIIGYAKSGAASDEHLGTGSVAIKVDGTFASGDRPPSKVVISTNEAGASGATERVAVKADGVVQILSGQLQFPSVQLPSSNANTLDDYEEGTFTPTIVGSGGGTPGAYSVQIGRYVKIGRNVFVHGFVAISNLGTVASSGGILRIGGLPFTALNLANYFAPVTVGFWNNIAATTVSVGGIVTNNTDYIRLTRVTTAGAGSSPDFAVADATATTSFVFSAYYEAAN
jgi:hypothetical protein